MKQCLHCGSLFAGTGWRCPQCHWEPELLGGFPSFASDLAEKSKGFSPDAHDELVNLENQCFWFRGRNKLLQYFLNYYFSEAQNLFEVGCGTGFVLAGFASIKPEMHLVGGEIYLSGLKQAKARVPQAELLQMNACCIPYVDEFDVVGAFDVLEHLDDDLRVLREIFKAVKPGGGVIVTVPQHKWLWSMVDEIACHKRRYSRKALKARIEAAGFRVLKTSSFVTLLLPVMVVSRLKYRKKTKSITRERVIEEFNIPSLLDSLFEKILDLERVLLRMGVAFPAGGSLLCVGVK